MELSYWLSRWNKGHTGFHMEDGYPGLIAHWPFLSISPDSVVLIPLSGKSPDIHWISGRVKKVICSEISPIAIEQFFEEHNLKASKSSFASFDIYQCRNIEFWCGDFMKLPEGKIHEIDLIYDKAAFVALPQKMRISYSRKIVSLSSAKTKILLHLLRYDQSEMNGPPFSIGMPEINRLFGKTFDIRLLQKNSLNIQNFEKFMNRGLKSDLIEYLLLLSVNKNC